MSASHRSHRSIATLIVALIALWGISAEAQNEIYSSTNLEGSKASYVIHLAPTYSGRVDKIRIKFPDGSLNGNIRLRDFTIAGKPVTRVDAIIDPGDPDALLIERSTFFLLRSGTSVVVELMGVQNPSAGNYQIAVTLHNAAGVVLETIMLQALSIAPLLPSDAGASGIVSVHAGTGLTGDAVSGTATLAISSGYRLPQSCTSGQVAKSNGPGVWSCATDSDSGGDIAAVIAGAGLAGGATNGDATLHVNTAIIQSRVTDSCPAGSSIRQINGDGTVDCENDRDSGGTVTGVTASAPLLSSGGATPNITLPNAFIDSISPHRTAIGGLALAGNTTGSENTAVGAFTLRDNTTGSFNTAIGARAGVSAGDLTNTTAIGYGAVADANDKIRLGNSSVTVIEGPVAFTWGSDRNQKENFRPVDGEEVLRKIRELLITSWNVIGHDPKKFRHYGPVAQDFFAAFGNDGLGQVGTETTINSGDIAGILMIAVQALEKRTHELIELEERVADLEKKHGKKPKKKD